MFFGRREPDKVDPEGLVALADYLFSKKIASFVPKASSLAVQAHRARQRFVDSCDEFGRVEAEPYTEDLWNPNINSIKSQKAAYSSTLRNLAADADLEPDAKAGNPYAAYNSLLVKVEDLIGKVLKANANFRIVLYSYSNYLGEFKKSFSSLESLRDQLKGELSKRSQDYETYTSIIYKISRLDALSEELIMADASMRTLEENAQKADPEGLERAQRELESTIEKRKAEAARVMADAAAASNRINWIFSPLKKASKKFDHASANKRQVSAMISDPVANLRDAGEYAELNNLLAQMKSWIESGRQEAPSKDDVIAAISQVANADIPSMIKEIDSLNTRKEIMASEILELERTLSGLRKGKEDLSKAIEQGRQMEKNASVISGMRSSLKAEIEKAFMESYGKPISINL